MRETIRWEYSEHINPETAIHQTGSAEITWHAGKWNLKINEKGQGGQAQ